MSYFDLRNEENAIMYIQRMLRDLDYFNNDTASFTIDGVYSDRTRRAVYEFQEAYELEPTGIVDYETWQLLNYIHKSELENQNGARAVKIVSNTKPFIIEPDTEDDIIYVIQYMLTQISTHHDELVDVKINGIYDLETQEAIMSFKRKNLIDPSPVIDAATLNLLFDEYEAVISREN